ncbi:hypothetical protein P175DRAFT_0512392 [Aspergillus ochraceoroseus IBT 24754]|uniref:Pinin/SDK/MemA protein domain-containing protein n=3 Tax=Aspergillus subgen. Nidulantes TaxID=2720870 RepID=A0A0F8U175_9EURO|nr:uncharacterized protein P175DRAFT_0512392 [Aspergillus ochraceoroseus IBT 24754]KKK13504.1 hypothetical protein ARAM_003523 [Aspergillus rambellii]KKK20346.1 hypothetical protein AOCH_001783 [Aspergillus ochraceoroseus]PTU17237.1 hypothetical protein P175DRAFT_0512392 [Aspergillus ochraceoroseus IBT 24754]
MAEGSLASAVVLPDVESPGPSPDAGLKRKQSSTTDQDTDLKRRRLSGQIENQPPESAPSQSQSSPGTAGKDSDRRLNRRDEERKRGQRLFGSLLGTLSQSSNSAAQRRRADIERKQQDKLKLQDEEYGELKKKRREERIATRKKEQKLYEKEVMQTRHTNLVAMAYCLKTRTEPVLYYKPWQLRPQNESIIRDQVHDAEATVARELEEFEARSAAQEEEALDTEKQKLPEETAEQASTSKDTQNAQSTEPETDPARAETNHDKDPSIVKTESTPAIHNDIPLNHDQADVHRGAEDDGGEVVEDNEDTVIY